jgi:hypothetical protein
VKNSPSLGSLRLWAPAAVLVAVFSLSYAPDVGRGFIKDDFRWILESRVQAPADIVRPFVDTTGFFRPIVSLTFAANERLFGTDPGGYGVTNLLLAVACALAVGWLARGWDLPTGACLLASAVWLMNFHGINMAVLWISGRTALLLVLFAVLAASAATRQSLVAAALLAFLAMLSKEEAVLLGAPLLLIVWLRAEPARRPARTAQAAALLGVAGAGYLWLRLQSDALMPSNAPAYYRFAFDRILVLENALHYLNRGASLAAAVIVLAVTIVRRRPQPEPHERAVVMLGAIWFVAGYALTVFLPSRSSLYACYPSVGAALAAGALGSALWRRASDRQRRALSALAFVLPLALIPVYKARNDRWVDLAVLSSSASEAIRRVDRAALGRGPLVFIDDRRDRANLESAFGWLLPDAVELLTGQRPEVWIVPPLVDAGPEAAAVPPTASAVLVLRGRELVGGDSGAWAGAAGTVLR